MKPIRLPAGTVLFNQGEPGDGLYLILEGEVAIHSDGVQIAIRGPGECVGELAVLDDAPRSAAVTAKTDAVLLKCDRDDFHQIVATSRGVAGALFRMLGQKIREETAQHITIVRQQEQLQQDLRRAHEIQTAMLPGEDLSLDWLHLSGRSQPAAVVGGDYYDYFPLPDGRVGIAIGDVVGHGFYSSLLVAIVSSALRFQVERDADPAAVRPVLNQVVQDYHHARLLMTFSYMVLNPADHTLTLTNAGHPYPCLYRQRGQSWTALELESLPLGVFLRGSSQPITVAWEPGDRLFLHTDGLTEAQNARDEPYGVESLLRFLERHATLPPGEMISDLYGALDDYRQGRPFDDDVTAVGIEFLR
jgi:sigma-B regulation protein RsbU (phosphoserine phosphatase)